LKPATDSALGHARGENGYRSTGVGYNLNQSNEARRKRYRENHLTFDPLRSSKCPSQLRQLGVIADRYKNQLLRETSSTLHRTGTDRLWVTWHLRGERVDGG
jgi:predicted GNAT superfamily acetyltransferase